MGNQGSERWIYASDKRACIEPYIDTLRTILKKPGACGLGCVVSADERKYLLITDADARAAYLCIAQWV
jgi:hypothetical protein